MTNQLESNVNKAFEIINNNNLGFGWKNEAKRNFDGTYIKGECFDYILLKKDKTICFDCKETTKDIWSIKQKDVLQAVNLKKASNFNSEAFFLIYFKSINKIIKLDIHSFFKIWPKRKSIKWVDGIIFDIQKEWF